MAQVHVLARNADPSRSCTGLGMRRVGWVRVLVRPDGEAVCHVIGTGHRLPTARRVPLGTALGLAAEGVPCVVRGEHRRTPVGPAAG